MCVEQIKNDQVAPKAKIQFRYIYNKTLKIIDVCSAIKVFAIITLKRCKCRTMFDIVRYVNPFVKSIKSLCQEQ